ncbi:MAG: helix-turn-helix transcriptional regulator [Bacteroidia bacterium]|nr:helix-turn-helix transcriptional regulator [Bacteroidia bacterium]
MNPDADLPARDISFPVFLRKNDQTSNPKHRVVLRLNPHNLFSYRQKADNCTIHSNLSHFQTQETSTSLSLKMVLHGNETYHFRTGTKTLKQGEFLLVDRGTDYICDFTSPQPVEGICIYLGQALMQDVSGQIHKKWSEILENPVEAGPGWVPGFFLNTHSLSSHRFGRVLHDVKTKIVRDDFSDTEEFYYGLAEALLCEQTTSFNEMQSLTSLKESTREELFRRLHLAKNLIEEKYSEKIDNDLLAREACLSKYHFLRTFKQAFGTSPRQYLITKRLEVSRRYLRFTEKPVDEIANLCGFTDIFSFSGTFKKHYAVSPSEFRRINSYRA